MKRVGSWQCSDGLPGHPIEHVRVTVRNGNYSAFHGYRFTPSDYSALVCEVCGTPWRSKARYVDRLRDRTAA